MGRENIMKCKYCRNDEHESCMNVDSERFSKSNYLHTDFIVLDENHKCCCGFKT